MKKILTLMSVIGAVSSFAGLSVSASAATPADTLVMAWNIDSITTFDPAQVNEVVTNEILLNLCDTLVDYDPEDESKIIPRFAESWDVSDDRRTLTFHLRKGAKFPSGNPVTAEDAAWSLQRIVKLKLANALSLSEFGFVPETIDQTIKATDENTLVLKLDKPYPSTLILQAIGAYRTSGVLDRKTVLENEVAGDMGNKYLTTHTECVGPYRLARWNAGEAVLLEANQNYWGSAPKLKRVLIRHVAETGTQRLLVAQGDVDVARDLTPQDMADLEKSGKVELSIVPTPQMLYWNINNRDAPLSNDKVRLAFRYLVDYDGLAKTVMHLIGSPRASLVQLGAVGALDLKEGQPFKLDLDKAKALLAEAGYENGFSTTLAIGSHPYSAAIAQSLQQNASKVGISIKIESMANAQLFSRVRSREYETVLQPWLANVPDAYGMVSRFIVNPDNRSEAKLGNLPSWRSSYYSPEMNKRAEDALFEPDDQKRIEMYHSIQRDQLQNGPHAFLFQLNAVSGLNAVLKNWTQNGLRAYYDKASK